MDELIQALERAVIAHHKYSAQYTDHQLDAAREALRRAILNDARRVADAIEQGGERGHRWPVVGDGAPPVASNGAAPDAEKRKATFADLVKRTVDAVRRERSALADGMRKRREGESEHLRAQVLTAYNCLADMHEMDRESRP